MDGLSRTPELDRLEQKWPAEPGTTADKLAERVVKLGNTLRRRKPESFVAALEKALLSDLSLNYPLRDTDQINRLVRAALLDSVQRAELSDVRPADVPAVKQRLNTLSGRVRILCDAATSGIADLLKRPSGREDSVDLGEVSAAIRLGLNLVFPESRDEKEDRLDGILDEAERFRTFGRAEYMNAALNILRRQVQEYEIGNVIMAQFAGLGPREEVVPFVLTRLQNRVVGLELKAGTMFDGAIRDLELALDDETFISNVNQRWNKSNVGQRWKFERSREVEWSSQEAQKLKNELDELV